LAGQAGLGNVGGAAGTAIATAGHAAPAPAGKGGLPAARIGDPVGSHNSSGLGAVLGGLAGFAIGALGVAVAAGAIVLTAGMATPFVAAAYVGVAAAGVGAVASTAAGVSAGAKAGQTFKGSPCSKIATGSSNVNIESKAAARAKLDEIAHGSPRPKVKTGAATVIINGVPAGRESEKSDCGGAIISSCARRTFLGGPSSGSSSSSGAGAQDGDGIIGVADSIAKWAGYGALGLAGVAIAAPLAVGTAGVAAFAGGAGMLGVGFGLGQAGEHAGSAAGKWVDSQGDATPGRWENILGFAGGSAAGMLNPAKAGRVVGRREPVTELFNGQDAKLGAKYLAERATAKRGAGAKPAKAAPTEAPAEPVAATKPVAPPPPCSSCSGGAKASAGAKRKVNGHGVTVNRRPGAENETQSPLALSLRTVERAKPLIESIQATGEPPPGTKTKPFDNRTGVLPSAPGRKWRATDVAVHEGDAGRGANRLLYSNDGLVYVTPDHFENVHPVIAEPRAALPEPLPVEPTPKLSPEEITARRERFVNDPAYAKEVVDDYYRTGDLPEGFEVTRAYRIDTRPGVTEFTPNPTKTYQTGSDLVHFSTSNEWDAGKLFLYSSRFEMDPAAHVPGQRGVIGEAHYYEVEAVGVKPLDVPSLAGNYPKYESPLLTPYVPREGILSERRMEFTGEIVDRTQLPDDHPFWDSQQESNFPGSSGAWSGGHETGGVSFHDVKMAEPSGLPRPTSRQWIVNDAQPHTPPPTRDPAGSPIPVDPTTPLPDARPREVVESPEMIDLYRGGTRDGSAGIKGAINEADPVWVGDNRMPEQPYVALSAKPDVALDYAKNRLRNGEASEAYVHRVRVPKDTKVVDWRSETSINGEDVGKAPEVEFRALGDLPAGAIVETWKVRKSPSWHDGADPGGLYDPVHNPAGFWMIERVPLKSCATCDGGAEAASASSVAKAAGARLLALPPPKGPAPTTMSINDRIAASRANTYESANATRGWEIRKKAGLSAAEFAKLHPEPDGKVYHDPEHSLKVAGFNGRIAEAHGVTGRDLKLVETAGLLHDVDPVRAAGKPPSVARTIDWIRANQDKLDLTSSERTEVEAMIRRTEFPFSMDEVMAGPDGVKRPPPSWAPYGGKSPQEVYEASLLDVAPDRRAFVMENAQRLSKYADQGSYYVEGMSTMESAVQGLSAEIGVPLPALRKGTPGFLSGISKPPSIDADMASRLGVDAKFTTFDVLGRKFPEDLVNFNAYVVGMKAATAAPPVVAPPKD
jgi:uncharacterized Zn-binding protein involved in type VI secretion